MITPIVELIIPIMSDCADLEKYYTDDSIADRHYELALKIAGDNSNSGGKKGSK